MLPVLARTQCYDDKSESLLRFAHVNATHEILTMKALLINTTTQAGGRTKC